MAKKPTYEELERRVQELEKIESERNQGEDIVQDGQYRWLVENANELILVAQEGLIRFVNQKVFDYLGYSPEELKDRPFIKYIYPEDREKVSERHLKRLKGEDLPGVYPFRVVDRDGKVRWMEINAVRSEWNGKPATLNYINDITERKRAEETLREQLDFSESLIETAQAIILVLDPQGRIVRFNSYMEDLVGYDLDEVKGKDWFETFIKPENGNTVKSVFQKAVDNIQTLGNVNSIIAKDGRTILVDWYDKTLKDKNSCTVGVLAIGYDITERKRAEEALRDKEAWLGETMRIARVGGWKVDLLGNTLEWTDETFRIHELPTGDPPNVAEAILFYHAEDRPRVSASVQHAIENGEGYDFEARIITAKQNLIWVRTIGHVSFHEGHITIVWGTIQDITDRKRAEAEQKKLQAQLNQAQKMESIGSLAGGIAHDFNNILFSVVGLSEMMLNDFPSDSLEHQNIREIFTAGTRGRELVQQILSFSRQSEHQPIPVHIQKILKEVLKLCRSTIPTDIEIKQDIQTDCNSVMADPTQIHQIAMNLITNAFHAVESAGGTIKVQLKEIDFSHEDDPAVHLTSGRYTVLSVTDNGTGIDPAVVKKIFDPYFTTKEKGKGTGLGLATVYGIVKAHGGDIRVHSEAGKGSSFHVYLPVLEKSADVAPEKQQQPLATGSEHILLVDDEAPIVHMEKQMLERLGYRITCFSNSVDALAAFRTDPYCFDLILTDMNMPNLNGMQLAEELNTIKSDIPVIICTGFSERINKEIAATKGIREILMKPVVMIDLAQKVREVLDTMKK